MATASHIQLDTSIRPEYFRDGITSDAAKEASDLLQENHEQHHIFFNNSGFHNHIVHHLLAIWSMGASPEEIKRAYDENAHYQLQIASVDENAVATLARPETFLSLLNQEKHYTTYLNFFRGEIDRHGWQNTVQEYLFSGSEIAETMLVRAFGGFLHPIIHLGYGMEFEQPAIIAEALAQTALHDDYLKALLFPAETAAKKHNGQPSKSIVELLDIIHSDAPMRASADWNDGNKLRDGVLKRAGQRTVELTSQYHISPAELQEKTAEMVNAACWYTAGAQRPGKMIKFDFYFIHCVNSSIFWSAFLKQSWISDAYKVRLLEWKVRVDLAMYASRRCPDTRFDLIREYQPKQPSGWDGIQDRVLNVKDDGHSAKLIRALAHGQQISAPYQEQAEFRIKHDDWLQIAHAAIDSCEDVPEGQEPWVRSAGFDQAWESVPAARL